MTPTKPNEIFPAQRTPVGCSCGGVAFLPLAAIYVDRLDVTKKELDPFAFVQCVGCGKVAPVNAPVKSTSKPD